MLSDGSERAMNLEQQIDEAEVLRSICGEDCLLLAPVAVSGGSPLADTSGAGSGSVSNSSSTRSSSPATSASADQVQPNVAALTRGQPMQLQIAIHVQVPSEGLALQVCLTNLPRR